MAVPEQTPYSEHIGNGVTKSFALNFDCESKDHLIVLVDEIEPPIATWSLSACNVVFTTAPASGSKITLQRNTPFSRTTDYQSFNNSFRPQTVNGDFDRLWLKLQELGVADWILINRIEALKNYVDDRDDELRAYLMEEIRKQGVALDQLDEYYNYLMERLAQIAVDKGWDSSFVVDGDQTQKQINDNQRKINSRTATPYDHGAIGDGMAHPLSERYATLAEAQAVYPSATALTEYIDGHALNAWWRDICANDRKFATCHGKFVVNINISNRGLNNYLNRIKTSRVDFNADIQLRNITGNGFEIISPRQCDFTGYINIWDAGGAVYANKSVDNCMYMEDFIHGNFRWKVVSRNAKKLGLRAYGSTLKFDSTTGLVTNNNTSDLGSWLFLNCGHRFKDGLFNFVSRLDSGSSDQVDQRTTLTLSSTHGFDSDLNGSIIRYKNEPYYITDSTANTITVYSWIKELDTSGTFEISTGGDFELIGADSNLIRIDSGSSGCALCARTDGLYVGTRIQRTNEGNDVGLMLGRAIDQAQVAGTYIGMYFELNEFDVLKTSYTPDNPIIINPIGPTLSKCRSLAPINAVTRLPKENLISSFNLHYGNKIFKARKYSYYNGTNTFADFNLKIGDEHLKVRTNFPVITLQDDPDVRRLFGTCDVSIEISGTALSNGTSGTTTIKSEAGYTINGSTSDFIIPASSSAFTVSARLLNGVDWRISIFYAEKPFGSKSHNWNPLVAGARQLTTVAVPGARMGSGVIASMDVSLKGTILSAEVTSFGIVTVTQSNPDTSSVGDVSGNLFVKLV